MTGEHLQEQRRSKAKRIRDKEERGGGLKGQAEARNQETGKRLLLWDYAVREKGVLALILNAKSAIL